MKIKMVVGVVEGDGGGNVGIIGDGGDGGRQRQWWPKQGQWWQRR